MTEQGDGVSVPRLRGRRTVQRFLFAHPDFDAFAFDGEPRFARLDPLQNVQHRAVSKLALILLLDFLCRFDDTPVPHYPSVHSDRLLCARRGALRGATEAFPKMPAIGLPEYVRAWRRFAPLQNGNRSAFMRGQN